MRDLEAALRALGTEAPVLAVSALPPGRGIEALADAFDAHRTGLDVAAARLAARRAGALGDFAAEHGERGLRALGGRAGAERLLTRQDAALDEPALVRALEAAAGI